MSPRLVLRRILLGSALMLLLTVAWVALSGAFRQLARPLTVGQQVETGLQFACGLLSLLSALTSWRSGRWRRPVFVAWTVSLMTTAGLSSLVWGPVMPITALVLALVALLFALAVSWLIRVGQAA